MKKPHSLTPLTPAVFHILMALSSEPKHGYGIMKQVAYDSCGRVKMGPGTLYGSISRMLDAGLIKESEDPDQTSKKERRIYYTITGQGQKAFTQELQRYREIVRMAEEKQLSVSI